MVDIHETTGISGKVPGQGSGRKEASDALDAVVLLAWNAVARSARDRIDPLDGESIEEAA